MDGRISFRQRTEQPDTMRKSCPETEDGSEEEESEEDQEKWRRSPRGWMGAGAEAALEDQAQASSGQTQSDGKLEAGSLMADQAAGFGFICFDDFVLLLTCG